MALHADLNGRFTSRGWMPNKEFAKSDVSFISAVLDGANVGIPMLDGSTPIVTKDTVSISAYARPGVSGGAFYQDRVLVGLIARVSLAVNHLPKRFR